MYNLIQDIHKSHLYNHNIIFLSLFNYRSWHRLLFHETTIFISAKLSFMMILLSVFDLIEYHIDIVLLNAN